MQLMQEKLRIGHEQLTTTKAMDERAYIIYLGWADQ
jgi:hypothetical protein